MFFLLFLLPLSDQIVIITVEQVLDGISPQQQLLVVQVLLLRSPKGLRVVRVGFVEVVLAVFGDVRRFQVE